MPTSTLDVKTDLHGSTKKLEGMDDALEGMQEQAKTAGGSIEDMGEKFKNAGQKMVIAGAAILGGLALLVKGTSDAEETTTKFGTVFQDVFEEASLAVKDLTDNYGLSRNAAKEMLGGTGDLLTGLGLTGEAALDLSLETQKLSVDLASFTNFSGGAKGASEALTKAMLGEREMVKSLGIVITEEMIKEKLLKEGKNKLRGMALLQAKAELTLQIAVEQSKNAMGDYQRTQEGLANSSRELIGKFEDLRNSIGEKLIPVTKDLVNTVKDVVEGLTEWVDEHPELTGKIVLLTGKLGIFLTIGGSVLIILPKLIKGYRDLKLAAAGSSLGIARFIPILGAVVVAMEAGKLVSAGLKENFDKNRGAAILLREEMEKLEALGLRRIEEAYKTLIDVGEDVEEGQENIKSKFEAVAVTMEELTTKYGDNKEKIDQLISSGIVIVKTEEDIQEVTENLIGSFDKHNSVIFDAEGRVRKLKNEFEEFKTPAELLKIAVDDFTDSVKEIPIELDGVPATIEGILDSIDFDTIGEDAIAAGLEVSLAIAGQAAELEELVEKAKERMATLARDIGDSWGQFFLDVLDRGSTFKENLDALWANIKRSFAYTIADMIADMVAKFLEEKLFEPIIDEFVGLFKKIKEKSEEYGGISGASFTAGWEAAATAGMFAWAAIVVGGLVKQFIGIFKKLPPVAPGVAPIITKEQVQKPSLDDIISGLEDSDIRIRPSTAGGAGISGLSTPETPLQPMNVTLQIDKTTLAEILVAPLSEEARKGNFLAEEQNLIRTET